MVNKFSINYKIESKSLYPRINIIRNPYTLFPMVSQLIIDHLSEEKIEIEEIKRLWLHQANKSMNDFIGKKVLGRVPEEHEQPNILQDYANTSSAGSIIAFSLYSQDMKSNEVGVLCSFGAGYSAGSIILRKVS